MSKDQEKYLHFQVGLLKGSSALDALRKDALKYHMIDQPGQLIALRLTEYYELMARGMVPPTASAAIAANDTGVTIRSKHDAPQVSSRSQQDDTSPAIAAANNNQVSSTAGKMSAYPPDADGALVASPEAERNAEEAADYWALL